MKYLLLVITLITPLCGQGEAGVVEWNTFKEFRVDGILTGYLNWSISRNSDGSKSLVFDTWNCDDLIRDGNDDRCIYVESSQPKLFGELKKVLDYFQKKYADDVRHLDLNGRRVFATATSNPQLTILNGFGDNSVFQLDLKTLTFSTPVILPNGMSPTFGLRPTLTGDSREVWTHHSNSTGGQMVVTSLETGRIEGNIPVNTTAATNFSAVEIVFSSSGDTAYVISTEPTVDANGNSAAMRMFDATTRTLKSTARLPMVQAASAATAPDGLTLYIFGVDKLSREQIIYYDVLSDTADLSALLQEPLVGAVGLFNSLFPISTPQLHPNGNLIFFLHNFQVRAGSPATAYAVSVFDLAQRKIVNKFPLTFANDAKGLKLELSQDGTRLTILSDKGQVQFMDPISGQVIGVYQAPSAPLDIFTTPLIP
ncbi:MAG: hypothetical protein ABIR70_17880 [Bryobacteraceae bacterium]